jgi:hypothetical protein
MLVCFYHLLWHILLLNFYQHFSFFSIVFFPSKIKVLSTLFFVKIVKDYIIPPLKRGGIETT